MNQPDPFAALTTVDAVRAVWRRLVLTVHPDHGGDPREFTRLHRLYRDRLDRLRVAPCPTCLGARTVKHRRGFQAVSLPCPNCS